MPVCGRCGVDQPEDAFSDESHPLCEYCYATELEEEAAGGEIGNDTDMADLIAREGTLQDADQEEDDEEQTKEEDEENKKPKKFIPLSGAARLLNLEGITE